MKRVLFTAVFIITAFLAAPAVADDCERAKQLMKDANQTASHERAEALFVEAATLCPKSPAANYNAGAKKYDRGDFAGAAAYFKKALDLKPDLVEAMNALALSYASQGINYEESMALIQKALKARPRDTVLMETEKVIEASRRPSALSISSITFKEPSGSGTLHAGDKGAISVTLKNSGKGIAFGVALGVEAKSGGTRGMELRPRTHIGQINPGEEKTITVEVVATEAITTSDVELRAHLIENRGFDSQPIILAFKTREFQPPLLQIAKIEVMDSDGKRAVSKGKETELTITVQNAGQGAAKNVVAVLDIRDKEIRSFSETTVDLGTIAPGESKKATYNLAVTNRYSGAKTLPVSFRMKEEREKYSAVPEIKLALNEDAPDIRVVKVESRKSEAKAAPSESIDDIPTIDSGKRVIGPNDLAIVIGIEQYKNAPKSEFSYNDARLVKGYLKALGFAERNIEFLADGNATGTSFKKAFEAWLPNRAKKDSRVLVYYSGHGAPDASGEAYMLPHDGDPEYLGTTGYPLKRLYEALGKLETQNVAVVLDSCFSGAGGRSVLARSARPIALVNEGIVPSNVTVLSSTKGSQISASSPEKEHGIFTYYFLKAIKDGKKDLAEVFEYVRPLVEDEAKAQNVNQSPTLNPEPGLAKSKFTLFK